MKRFLIVLLFSTLVLFSNTEKKVLDTGVSLPKIYTKEMVSAYIGQKATVSYKNNTREDKVTLKVLGVLWDRFKKEDNYLLLGYTEFKNRMVIPIDNIILIEEIL